MKPLVIIGAGGHGRVILDCAKTSGLDIAGFLDSKQQIGATINGVLVLGDNSKLNDADFINQHSFIVALGNQQARKNISQQILELDGELATIIHPSATISPHTNIGKGCAIIAGSIINSGANIGDYCIINTGATIDHDVTLSNGVQVCPGANLAGSVSCKEGAFIGTGAVIIPNIDIGINSKISAGAIVMENVKNDVTVTGNPAKPIN